MIVKQLGIAGGRRQRLIEDIEGLGVALRVAQYLRFGAG